MKTNTCGCSQAAERLTGTGVALVTPFNEKGEVDYPALGKLVDHVIAGGVDYLVALGTTAETPTLSCEEKREIFYYIRQRNANRLPLVVGIGGNNTAHVVKELQEWDMEGVTAVLSVTPYYNRPSQEGLFQHYKAIAEASPRPVILYNVPPRTGVNMTAATTLRLAREVPNLVAVKEACGNIEQMQEILDGRPEGFLVLSGDDGMAVPLIERGGEGLISVAANAFPAEFSSLVNLAREGKKAPAEELWTRLSEATAALFYEGNPTGIKCALAIKGLIQNTLRLPLVPSTDDLTAKMRDIFSRNGL